MIKIFDTHYNNLLIQLHMSVGFDQRSGIRIRINWFNMWAFSINVSFYDDDDDDAEWIHQWMYKYTSKPIPNKQI